jgi:hypothetical protein
LEVASRLAQPLLANGLHEYYDPYTGRGMGASEFTWSALAIELTERDPAAGSSYLSPGAFSPVAGD